MPTAVTRSVISFLSKEEMLKDGQDEPVTSMPMKEMADAAQQQSSGDGKTYAFDPMNPPSF